MPMETGMVAASAPAWRQDDASHAFFGLFQRSASVCTHSISIAL